MILYVGNPKESTKKSSKTGNIAGYKINIQKQLFLCTSYKQWDMKIKYGLTKTKIPFLSQTLKCNNVPVPMNIYWNNTSNLELFEPVAMQPWSLTTKKSFDLQSLYLDESNVMLLNFNKRILIMWSIILVSKTPKSSFFIQHISIFNYTCYFVRIHNRFNFLTNPLFHSFT